MAAIADGSRSSGGFAAWWRHTATTRTAWLYLLPAFLVMGLITFYPLFYQVWMSTTDYGVTNLRIDSPAPNPANQSEACNTNLKGQCTWGIFENYHQIFNGNLPVAIANFSFWNVLAFDLVWTFTNVPFHVIIGVLIAVLLNTKGLWFKKFYRAIFVLPIVIPSLVVAVVWRNMFDADSGSINQMLTTRQPPLRRRNGGVALARSGQLSDHGHSLDPVLFCLVDRQYLAGLAVHDDRGHRRAAEHPC